MSSLVRDKGLVVVPGPVLEVITERERLISARVGDDEWR